MRDPKRLHLEWVFFKPLLVWEWCIILNTAGAPRELACVYNRGFLVLNSELRRGAEGKSTEATWRTQHDFTTQHKTTS